MRSDLSAAVTCESIAEALPGVLDGGSDAGPAVVAHVDSCLRCQAELVQYRRLLKALHQLRTDVLEPSPGLLTDIFARLEAAGERNAIRSLLTGRRMAYAGAIAAAATAAGAAGVIVLARRSGKRAA